MPSTNRSIYQAPGIRFFYVVDRFSSGRNSSGKKIYLVLLKNMKKMHSRCEIEAFVETHICKLCVILRSPPIMGRIGVGVLWVTAYLQYNIGFTVDF